MPRAGGIGDGLVRAQLDRFDLIGFDACLMATYEIAAVLAPFADTLLASEELEPGHGWDYRALEGMRSGQAHSPDDVGALLVAGCEAHSMLWGTFRTITLSLLDLGAIAALTEELEAFSQLITRDITRYAATMGRQRESVLRFGGRGQRSGGTWMYDLGHLISLAATEAPELAPAAARVNQRLNAVVRQNHIGPLVENATGISIYFPTKEAYRAGYDDVDGIDSWRNFISSLYSAGDEIEDPVVFATPERIATVTRSDDGVEVSGFIEFGASNVVATTLTYGFETEGGSIYLLGDVAGKTSVDDGRASAIWNEKILVLRQGDARANVYFSAPPTSEGDVIRIDTPFSYRGLERAAERVVMWSVVVNISDGRIEQQTFYTVGNLYGEFLPQPGSNLYPLVKRE